MDSAWVLRSPHVDGVHLVVRALPGAHETLARLVAWTSLKDAAGVVDVLDATMLPAGIQAVSWCGCDAASPVRLATCSTQGLHVIDLAYHTHPRRVRSSFKPDGAGELCAGVAWAGCSGKLIFARGGSIHALDAETSARVWNFPAGGNREIPSSASVASFAAIDEHKIVASWAAPSSEAGGGNNSSTSGCSGSLHLLDLREPPGPLQRTALASGTTAVKGLSSGLLQPQLIVSHAEVEGLSELFVWDVRQRCKAPQPVSLLHGGGASLRLGPLQCPVGLEWSPAKEGSLLAVSTGGPGGPSVQACRLWPLQQSGYCHGDVCKGTSASAANGAGTGLGVGMSWLGEARPMRLLQPPSEDVGPSKSGEGVTASASASASASIGCCDIVAAGWAHVSRSGMALALRNSGAIVALGQQAPRLCAWSPRGGALLARPWSRPSPSPNPNPTPTAAACTPTPASAPASACAPAPASAAAAGEVSCPTLSALRGGVPPVLEQSTTLAEADICCRMRKRAAALRCKPDQQAFDGYSNLLASAGAGANASASAHALGRETAVSEALSRMWQWAKLADAAAGSADAEAEAEDGDAALHASAQQWKGVQTTLNLDEPSLDEASEPFRGVYVYTSPGRVRSLQALGFPQAEEPPSPHADSQSSPVDDVVRRVLRAVIWLQFERAAIECKLLEPHCNTSARQLLPHLVLVFHAASCLLAGAAMESGADEGAPRKNSGGQEPVHAHAVHSSPAVHASSLHAFHSTLQNLLDMSWPDFPCGSTLKAALQFLSVAVRGSLSLLTPDSFESSVGGLLNSWMGLTPSLGDSPSTSTGAAPSPEFSQFSQFSQFPALAPPCRSGTSISISMAFRCGLALHFLSKASLEAALDALCGECFRSGLPEGLCLLGLGGADTSPVTPSMLEELRSDAASPSLLPLPPLLPVSPSSTRRSSSMPSMAGPMAELQVGRAVDDGASLVRTYVAWTGDLQSAALLFCHSAHLLQPPLGLRHFFVQYAALLARWELYRQRQDLHTLLTSRLQPDEPGRSRGSVLFCSHCNGPLTGPLPSLPGGEADATLRRCPNANCAKVTPSCAVCLMPIFVVRSRAEDPDRTGKQSLRLAVDSWVAWCQGCHHGGHIGHLEEWFSKHNECPVAGCDCLCTLY